MEPCRSQKACKIGRKWVVGIGIVVVGAGPAGLSVARELRHRHGLSALVLDEADTPAASWRSRYDGFRLNTNGMLSHLPGQRIPLSAGRWPTRQDMVDYFDSYARRQHIALRLGCEVAHIDRAPDGGWQLATSGGELRATAVVLATGGYRTPTTPGWPGIKSFRGEVTHSGDYRNGWRYRGRNVLVVGAGNSGADIATGLVRDGAQRIWLAVRTAPHLVRRALGPIPSDILLEVFARVPAERIDPLIEFSKRLMWGDLSAYGFHRPPLGLKASVEQRGRIPTLADELVAAVRAGRVQVVAAVRDVAPDHVRLVDGSSVTPEVIITATGFAPDLHGLVGHLGVLDERGNPRGGFSTDLGDGLFAIGYGIPPSGPLRAIRRHATPLAGRVAAYVATPASILST
jgi:cation diffusion facilitator CzcD-associated flavoprotein CzcO